MNTRKGYRNHSPAQTIGMILAAAAVCVSNTAAVALEQAATAPVRLASLDLGRGRTLHLAVLDLPGGRVTVDSSGADTRYSTTDSFDSLVRRSGAFAAINGCFFDLDTGRLVGHIWHGGEQRVRGAFSAAFAVRKDNSAVIARVAELGDLSRYRVIIACVDILIRNGEILVKSRADLVRNGHNPSRSNGIYKPARWSAIGLDRSGQAYLVASTGAMSLYEFTRQVRARTAITDLLGLDGGTSSGLYVNGRYVSTPGRTVPSIIVAQPLPAGPASVAARP